MNNFKQPVYFHERKLKAPQKVQIRNSMSNMYVAWAFLVMFPKKCTIAI
jgi:hypothetical protein